MASTRSASMTRAETDLRALLISALRSVPFLLVVGALVATVVFLAVDRLTPLYSAEARVLVGIGQSDPAVVRSVLAGEIQLIRSPDIAEGVASSLGLAAMPEYQEAIAGGSLLRRILEALGLERDLGDASAEERVLAHYDDSLTVRTLDGSPLIVIAFRSADPELAARAANAVADAYLRLRQSATAETAATLEAEIDRLRAALAEADLRAAALRDEIAGLPPPLSAAEREALAAELNGVRDTIRRAEANAAAIRADIAADSAPSAPALLGDPAVRALLDEQRALRAELARETAANPLGNPRVAEIRARLASIAAELTAMAERIASSLDASAEHDRARLEELERRLADAAAASAAVAKLAALESEIAENRSRLDQALRRQEALGQTAAFPADVQILSRATVPATPDWPDVLALTMFAFLVTVLAGLAIVVARDLASGRATREVPFEPLAELDQPAPAAGRFRRIEGEDVPRALPGEPTLVPAVGEQGSLGAVADSIAGRRRVIVTLAEDSDSDGRPLVAVALSRALSGRDRSVVLVDLYDDGANGIAMGEAADLPGFADLLSGQASFGQVIFRDRRSRAHFIAAGLEPARPEALTGERLATLLAALDHTYDHVVIDCPDDAVARMARDADAALVASEHGSADPRTVRAVSRIAKVSAARIFHLRIEPGRRPSDPGSARAAEAA